MIEETERVSESLALKPAPCKYVECWLGGSESDCINCPHNIHFVKKGKDHENRSSFKEEC